ncbi:MAG: hypothetical protein ACREH6_06840 [Geminicoccaceae bacterium]
MSSSSDALMDLIRQECATTALPPVVAVAEAARRRHGEGVVAVLFYGSCLRESDDQGKMVDLYLLVESYRKVHPNRLIRLLNALLPPNVYYLEASFEERTIRAKYAIVELAQFEDLLSQATFEPYFWARFAQPTVILSARDDGLRERIAAALANACRTLLLETAALLPPGADVGQIWTRAFAESYATELRAEGSDRADALYRANAARYREVASAILRQDGPLLLDGSDSARRRAVGRWRRRRLLGKLLGILRLVKAALTFENGAAYLAWKIQRHSGVELHLTPWQKRHPVLASSVLFWRVYRAGGFR